VTSGGSEGRGQGGEGHWSDVWRRLLCHLGLGDVGLEKSLTQEFCTINYYDQQQYHPTTLYWDNITTMVNCPVSATKANEEILKILKT
jgi:hypothetical protein